MKRYNPKDIEAKWQQVWEETKLYETDDHSTKPKAYILDFFPYPSGVAMHMGHVRNYTISDVVSRYARMRGHEVLHPMGWDAFGLPAENYAIQNNVSPREAINQNTARFKDQFRLTGMSYDWSREIDSSDPNYYKWTQWFFLMLFKKGLAYRKDGLQNWCPNDKTVLANEQIVVKDGVKVCERCGHAIEKKQLKQWFFKITDYADRLLEDLDSINWPEKIKAMQRNWIGRSVGAEVDFKLKDHKGKLTIFTTRPDTLFGATYMVLAPEHPLVATLTTAKQKTAVEKYQQQTTQKTELDRKAGERDKTGVFTGAYAINPVNDEPIPIWISDYVLMSYGSGAIMAVPAHDQRDYEFAKKFELPIRTVIEPTTGEPQEDPTHKEKIVALVENDKGEVLTINWGPKFGGRLTIGGTSEGKEDVVAAAMREIAEETGYIDVELIATADERVHHEYFAYSKGKPYVAHTTLMHFKLKSDKRQADNLDESEKGKFKVEWVSKEQFEREVVEVLHRYNYDRFIHPTAYGGEGIMVNSGKYDEMSSSEAREQIVADLAKAKVAKEQVNYKLRDWLISRQRYWGAPIPIIHCAKCGEVAVPDDQLPVTLPEMKDFHPSADGRGPLARVDEFVQTTCPSCGGPAERETDTMDGFACSSWYFLRFADPHNKTAAFDREKAERWLPVDRYVGGAEHAVMHLLYARFWTKVMFDEGLISFSEPFAQLRNQGMLQAEDGQKISKRLGNYVDPEELINQGYGADGLRTTVLFLAPYDQDTPWSNEGLAGIFRFLQRVWVINQEYLSSGANDVVSDEVAATELATVTHKAIKRVTDDLEDMGFNTAVSALMELTNHLYRLRDSLPYEQAGQNWREALEALQLMLAPFAPHMSEELWHQFGHEDSIHITAWPIYDEKLLVEELVTVVVQVNGKVRAQLSLAPDLTEDELIAAAQADPKVAKYLAEGRTLKTITVPNKLVSFVVK